MSSTLQFTPKRKFSHFAKLFSDQTFVLRHNQGLGLRCFLLQSLIARHLSINQLYINSFEWAAIRNMLMPFDLPHTFKINPPFECVDIHKKFSVLNNL